MGCSLKEKGQGSSATKFFRHFREGLNSRFFYVKVPGFEILDQNQKFNTARTREVTCNKCGLSPAIIVAAS